MLKDIDASTDAAAVLLIQLRKFFDTQQYAAAQRLVDIGRVSDVRILQGGSVVTGITGADPQTRQGAAGHRVYIQYRNTDGLKIEGECSCGERCPCVHVAAVAIAAAKSSGGPPADNRRMGIDPLPPARENALERRAPMQQRICYLFAAPGTDTRSGTVGLDSACPLRLSVWVAQTLVGDARIQAGACPYAARISDGNGEYPRYVDARDREIMKSLTAQHIDGPWELRGATGYDLLQRAVATGRAFWQTLDGHALKAGAAREILFAWEALANGDQRLHCPTAGSLNIILDLEPAIYIDDASGETGLIELPHTLDLLRRCWNRRAISPEQAAAFNESIARESHAAGFPRPRMLAVQKEARISLRARLILSAGPQATLHFVYNGRAVDGRSLSAEQDTVRQLDGDVVYEIERDRETERHMRAQLERFLRGAPESSETWLGFMMSAVPALQAMGWEITADSRFPYRIAAAGDWYTDIQTDRRRQEWFDLRLGVMVDGHPVNLLPALVLYLQGAVEPNGGACLLGEHLLVQLDDGRYLPVKTERIRRIAETLVELSDQQGLGKQTALRLPVTQAGRLAQIALEPDAPVLRTDDLSLRTLIDGLKSFSGIQPLPAPAHFQAQLRPYQQEGLGWLQFLRRYRLGGILADDMGLGKTVQTLAHLALEKELGRLCKPSLIVAPVSVLGNWQREISRLAPQLTSLTLHGTKRKELFEKINLTDVVIVGYPLLLLDGEMLLAREFCFLILDEAQMIKNPRAKVSQMARALRAEHRLCLTGTPMENHLGELWSLFDFVQPGLLGPEKQFQHHYRTPIEKSGDGNRARALSRRIEPFLLRRSKDAVARDLPPKIQIMEPIALDEAQRDFYDGIRLSMHRRVLEIIQSQGLARSHITVLDALLKLRQACCDPRLVNADAQTRAIPSAKLDWLTTALPELIAEGRRILLFSQFTSMLRLIETVVTGLSIPYCLLTGETRDRVAVVDRFQAGAASLFLISLKAGGTGLNLTAADTVIHYDPWWNPAAETQATDRAHRIGQDKPVFVYKLIAQGTIEEKIMQLQADKHALVNQLYAENGASPAHLSVADLEALFAP
jgi:superfamily II DNA or RNA helicase